MARVTIGVRADDGTTVDVTAESHLLELQQRATTQVGQLLDEAVRRVRAALELPEAVDRG